MQKTNRSRKLVLTALFMALIILQSLVPWLGTLPLGAFVLGAAVTIITYTVAIGAMVLGPATGGLLGLVWGLTPFGMPGRPYLVLGL